MASWPSAYSQLSIHRHSWDSGREGPYHPGGALEIATCSYAAFQPTMGTAIRISLGGPHRPEPSGREHWLYVAELAPRGWYFNAEPDVFARCYLEQLDRLS